MGYDGAFNLKSFTSTVTGYTAFAGSTTNGNDTKDRLTSEVSSRNGGFSNTFVYDNAGNPTTFKGGAARTYNSNNQLKEIIN
jgi:hypothetical protein